VSIKFWFCLPSSPLLGITVTVIAYLVALSMYARAEHNPIANLVLIAVTIVFSALKITRTPYRTYSDGARFVQVLLGPATVALPMRLWR
jgi:putative effector of murein hydrolase